MQIDERRTGTRRRRAASPTPPPPARADARAVKMHALIHIEILYVNAWDAISAHAFACIGWDRVSLSARRLRSGSAALWAPLSATLSHTCAKAGFGCVECHGPGPRAARATSSAAPPVDVQTRENAHQIPMHSTANQIGSSRTLISAVNLKPVPID